MDQLYNPKEIFEYEKEQFLIDPKKELSTNIWRIYRNIKNVETLDNISDNDNNEESEMVIPEKKYIFL